MIHARMPGFIASFLATEFFICDYFAGVRKLTPIRILEDGD
jgi:hypothetical protein